ncbi:MAG: hypothetical protein K8F92_10825 [Hyphomicrobium sp.]|nr:MAG: hypothetical protein F9K20_04250 [Hyphomicrobium sp.]MBZ0210131.1 hypothetical protein [Hyphomicrobium sp.]
MHMTKQAITKAEADHTPLPGLLNAVGEELHHLAAAVERLHAIVELPGVRDSLRDAHCFGVVQGIDHVTQNLVGISEFLSTLATAIPDEWALDTTAACDVVLIASLCERLKRPTMPRPTSSGCDECEFF